MPVRSRPFFFFSSPPPLFLPSTLPSDAGHRTKPEQLSSTVTNKRNETGNRISPLNKRKLSFSFSFFFFLLPSPCLPLAVPSAPDHVLAKTVDSRFSLFFFPPLSFFVSPHGFPCSCGGMSSQKAHGRTLGLPGRPRDFRRQ